MMNLERMAAYFESLTPETAQHIGAFYAADAWFKDPFNEVRGTEAISRIFTHMFEQVSEPRFRVVDRVRTDDGAFLTWEFTFRFRPEAPLQMVRGASHLRFDASGKVAYHRDYWDAAGELYEKLPLLGPVLRMLRRRLSAAG